MTKEEKTAYDSHINLLKDKIHELEKQRNQLLNIFLQLGADIGELDWIEDCWKK